MGERYNGMVLLTDEIQKDSAKYDQFVVGLGNELSNTLVAATSTGDGGFNRAAAVDVLLHALAATISGTDGMETHEEWGAFTEEVLGQMLDTMKDVETYGHLSIDFNQEDLVYDPEMGWTVTGDLFANPLRN